MRTSPSPHDNHERYVKLCALLGRHGTRFSAFRKAHRSRENGIDGLRRNLGLARVGLRPEQVISASWALAVLLSALMLIADTIMFLLSGFKLLVPELVLTISVPLIGRHALLTYPSKAANKMAERIMKDSSAATNMMIMSLRHEPSISRAVTFASRCDGEFPHELKGCLWRVVMGKHESFEEALTSLGERWSRSGDDLKSALNAMVTASREATHDGRRRALDRANQAMISGAKRRIEEYALSLSVPSMLIFGLGILLPLMVGSFLPMLSWNLWSLDGVSDDPAASNNSQSAAQMVFVMNVLFPAIALLVGMNAVSNHPLELEKKRDAEFGRSMAGIIVVIATSCVAAVLSWYFLDGESESMALLSSLTIPISIWLLAKRRRNDSGPPHPSEDLEQVLFKTGARMLEGENFEASLYKATHEVGEARSDATRGLSFGPLFSGGDLPRDIGARISSFGVRNALEGLRITRDAATKDEYAAGILAMDLAAYLKDLRDLEQTLRNRLKPIISMMKTTALLLAPIVLGVTYAIYLSLGSMMGGDAGTLDEGVFFLVLGIFLAQMNAVVVYFISGIEGRNDFSQLARSLGSYLLISELVYTSTALVASV